MDAAILWRCNNFLESRDDVIYLSIFVCIYYSTRVIIDLFVIKNHKNSIQMLSGVRYLQRSTIRDIPNDVLKVRKVKYPGTSGRIISRMTRGIEN